MAEEAQTNPSNPPPPPPSEPPTKSNDSFSNPEAENVSGMRSFPFAAHQMFPMMYPSLVAPLQNQEQNEQGQGLYAVPYSPFMGRMAEFPPSMLIPLTYKIPTRANSTGAGGEGQVQGQGQEARQQHGPQRQVVVRRFHFAFQLDLALIIKLAAVVFLFGQEGSNQRFILLVLFASLVYLYQTGALTPFIRRIQRGALPPRPRPAARPENAPAAAADDGNAQRPENNDGVENQNPPIEPGEPQAANENHPEPEQGNGINLRGIAREIQTFVVGFITSLLPGFHHND